MKKILDLRFIIGLFFLLTGVILFIGSLVLHPAGGKTETTNLWSGVVYVIFGLLMLVLWFAGRNKAEIEEPEG